MRPSELPVLEVLRPLAAALAEDGAAVLVAPPGAGKTTAVPLALLDARWLEGAKIALLEPRRLAVRAAARRMASLLGERVGETVGYRIRRETRIGPGTRIEVVTEGVLTRALQGDPELAGYGLVIFDELHERSLLADLGLALALEARRLFRPDLRLLAMSATLDAGPVAERLGTAKPAPMIEASGRQYPVSTRYLDRPTERPVDALPTVVLRALDEAPGDLLAFLPGAGEIRRTASRLEKRRLPSDVDLYPLFGALARGRQDRAIAPSPAGRRKVVLASAIAQTSLTIEGVRLVVDSGLMRVPRFRPSTGMTGLETLRVTRDVADQRRGRAGRTAPGLCYRLWTEGEQRGLVPHLRPEILDADLAPLALELALWGARPEELAWLDPPPAAALERAHSLLADLRLVDDGGELTADGRRVAATGLHPRLGRMLVRARGTGRAALACDLAALCAERDLLRRPGEPPDADLRLRLEALRRGGSPSLAGHEVDRGQRERVREEAATLRRALRLNRTARTTSEEIETSGELLALAYPDRIARRRETSGAGAPAGSPAGGPNAHRNVDSPGARYLLRTGRGAELVAGQSLARSEWLVAADVSDRGREARIHRAAPLEPQALEELFGDQIETLDRVAWNAATGRAEATRERRLGALVVATAPLADPPPERLAAAFLEGVRTAGLEALPWNRSTRQLKERLRFLHATDPEVWPDMGDEALLDALTEWLGPFVFGMRRLDDLARLDLEQVLWTRIGWPLKARADELAPTHLEVPSGSRIAVDYSDREAPALAARIQELFGWRTTPRIGPDRRPVTVRLLSPAQRPVQVTTDLESFWRTTYFDVKRELKGRYPKHHWPDDPLTAEATRRVRPRR